MKAGTSSYEILEVSKASSNSKGSSFNSGRRLYISTARQQPIVVKPLRCRAALTVEAPSTAQARDDDFSSMKLISVSAECEGKNRALQRIVSFTRLLTSDPFRPLSGVELAAYLVHSNVTCKMAKSCPECRRGMVHQRCRMPQSIMGGVASSQPSLAWLCWAQDGLP